MSWLALCPQCLHGGHSDSEMPRYCGLFGQLSILSWNYEMQYFWESFFSNRLLLAADRSGPFDCSWSAGLTKSRLVLSWGQWSAVFLALTHSSLYLRQCVLDYFWQNFSVFDFSWPFSFSFSIFENLRHLMSYWGNIMVALSFSFHFAYQGKKRLSDSNLSTAFSTGSFADYCLTCSWASGSGRFPQNRA